jgi:hypothetical protein
MTDRFQTSSPSLAGPASHGFAVTPSDSTLLSETTRGLYVGTTGNIAALMLSGASVTFSSVPAGAVLPVRLTKIMATGTTASNIVALV